MPLVTRAVPAITGVVLSALIALGATAGTPVLVAALILVVIVVATGWPGLLSLPTQRGSTTIIALCGAAAVGVVGFTTKEPLLRWLPVILALSVIVAFWHQLLRRDMRPRLVESVTGVVSGVVAVQFASGWAAALHAPGGLDLILTSAVGVAFASAATGLPWPQRITSPLGVLAAVAFSALAATFLPDMDAVPAALISLVAAVVVVALDRLLTVLPSASSRQTGMTIGAAGVACAGIVVYLFSRVIVG
jgi:hypothetical protein